MALTKALYYCTGKSNFEDVSLNELSQLCTDYPYFAVHHLLLAVKSNKALGTGIVNVHAAQVQKAALFANNPFWLEYQISNAQNELKENLPDFTLSENIVEPVIPAHFAEQPFVHPLAKQQQESFIIPESVATNQPFLESNTSEQSISSSKIEWTPYVDVPGVVSFSNKEAEVSNNFQPGIPDNQINEAIPSFQQPGFETSTIPVPSLETVKQMLEGKAPSNNTVDAKHNSLLDKPIGDSGFINNPQDATPTVHFEQPIAHSPIYPTTIPKPIVELANTAPIATETKNSDTSNKITDNQSFIGSSTSTPIYPTSIPKPIFEEENTNILSNNHTPINAVTLSEEATATSGIEHPTLPVFIEDEPIVNTTNAPSKLSEMLESQLTAFKKPVDPNASLEFENKPQHTIDYFASQGIKIDLTQQPQDKLTTQLRRFTDWLKQMKKVDPNPKDLGTDPELENAIADIAKTSVSAREIVTETMADIFVKQGKIDKAIQLYIKLSFLDADKSAYFAEKIQQLKGI